MFRIATTGIVLWLLLLAGVAWLTPSARAQDKKKFLKDLMAKEVTIDKGIDANTPLKDALDFLSDRYDFTIKIDKKAFADKGQKDVGNARIELAPRMAVPLGKVLKKLLDQLKVKGTYIIKDDHILVVPFNKDEL